MMFEPSAFIPLPTLVILTKLFSTTDLSRAEIPPPVEMILPVIILFVIVEKIAPTIPYSPPVSTPGWVKSEPATLIILPSIIFPAPEVEIPL